MGPKGPNWPEAENRMIERGARPRIAICLALLGLLLLLEEQGRATAQEAELEWQKGGAPSAGAWEFAVDPSNPDILYALNSDGLHRSVDAGATWAECNREARMMRLVAPQAGQEGRTLLYATTTGGLRVSEDGCATWRDLPAANILPSSAYVRELIPYPNNSQV